MRQVIHILKKDARRLRGGIALLNALAILQSALLVSWDLDRSVATRDFEPAGFITPLCLAAVILIGRLVHGEPIPGDRQFWITRPYRWKDLLAAKMAFLVLCLSLPVFLVQWTVLIAMGFPLKASLIGLAWTHLTLLVVFGLPALALAAVTPNLVRYTLTALGLAGLLPLLGGALAPYVEPWPATLDWIRNVLLGLFTFAVASVVLRLQYRARLTTVSRAVIAIAVVIGAGVYFALPLSFGLAVQASLPMRSGSPSDTLDALVHPVMTVYAADKRFPSEVRVRISDSDKALRTQTEPVRVDALRITLVSRTGRTWTSAWLLPSQGAAVPGLWMEQNFSIDPVLAAEAQNEGLSAHLFVYGTRFGESRPPVELAESAPYQGIAEDMHCSTAQPSWYRDQKLVRCRMPLAWMNTLVMGAFDGRDPLDNGARTRTFYFDMKPQQLSYSPFPPAAWDLGLSPTQLEAYFPFRRYEAWVLPRTVWDFPEGAFPSPSGPGRIALRVLRPVEHFYRDIEIRNLRLN